MATSSPTACRHTVYWGGALAAAIAVCALTASTVQAASQISDINVQGIVYSQVFDRSLGPMGEWSLRSTYLGLPGTAINSTSINELGGAGRTWFINPFASMDYGDGNIVWGGNPLTNDLSGGGRGRGLFGSGGHLTISGQLWDDTWTPVVTGVLLEADVSGFEIQETTATSDLFDLIGGATVVPTGGWLYHNNIDAIVGPGNGLGFFGSYQMGMSGTGADQGGMGFSDFQSTVDVINGLQLGIFAPEPAAALLFAAAGALALRRRRG